MTNAGELKEVIGGLVGFERTGSIADGPGSAGVGFSVRANRGWSPTVFHFAFGDQVRSLLGAIEFLSASGITSFGLTSETLAGNRREIFIEVHRVSG